MARLNRRLLWILALLLIVVLSVPNSILRRWLPRQGSLPTPTIQPTQDPYGDEFQEALLLVSATPLDALSILQEIAFSDSEYSQQARTIWRAIQGARFSDDPAYLLTESGRAMASIGEWRHARMAFLRAVELAPGYAEAWAFLGEAQQQNGEDGYPAIRTALELNPQSVAANLFGALYWQRQGDLENADRYLRIAALLAPNDPSIQMQWGQNAVLGGDVVAARERFERAAELSPDDPQVWRAVAYYSIKSELYVDEIGMAAARRLLQLSPNDPEPLTLIARANVILGRESSALRYFELALKTDPDYPQAHLYFGIFLLAKNELQEARFHLDRVIAISPGSEEAEIAARWIGLTYR